MNLHDLGPAKGARKRRKRIGRGPGSGHGKTSGKGHKGLVSQIRWSEPTGRRVRRRPDAPDPSSAEVWIYERIS